MQNIGQPLSAHNKQVSTTFFYTHYRSILVLSNPVLVKQYWNFLTQHCVFIPITIKPQSFHVQYWPTIVFSYNIYKIPPFLCLTQYWSSTVFAYTKFVEHGLFKHNTDQNGLFLPNIGHSVSLHTHFSSNTVFKYTVLVDHGHFMHNTGRGLFLNHIV